MLVATTDIGVPQGSILEPVWFSIYIDDLPDYLHKDTYATLFADDTYVGIREQNEHGMKA